MTLSNTIPLHKGTHWFWKSTKDMLDNPVHFYKDRMDELGPTFYVEVPASKILVTGDPELIKYNLQTNNKVFEKDRGYKQLALLLGQGLVTSKGEFWKKQRRIAQPAFYKKSLSKLFEDMRFVTKKYIKELNDKRNQEVDMSQEMMQVTARIAMKSLFTNDLKEGFKEIYDAISYSQEYVTQRFINPLSIPLTYINGQHYKFKKHKKVMDRLINNLIDKRKNDQQEYYDFMQMLLDARYEDGSSMPQWLILDELITIFSAGHETSSNGLTWTLYLLSQHPAILEKLKAEANQVLKGDEVPTYEDLKELVYTKQVLEESMRIFPPVWAVGRRASENSDYNGIKIAKNTPIVSSFYLLHHNPNIWENPDSFNPERFSFENSKTRPNHHYMPFGAGPRMCIGNHFAMMEMQLILPMLVKHFDFEFIKNQQIELEPLVTLRPKYGLKMMVR